MKGMPTHIRIFFLSDRTYHFFYKVGMSMRADEYERVYTILRYPEHAGIFVKIHESPYHVPYWPGTLKSITKTRGANAPFRRD